MIKAIFFDFDGVLTLDPTGAHSTCFYFSRATGISFDKLYACYRPKSKLRDLGQATNKELWNEFCKCVGKEIDFNFLNASYQATPVNKAVFDLARELRKNYKIGIITDNSRERWDALIKHLKLTDLFDSLVVSASVGSTKSDKNIFQVALKSVGVMPEESVFIDNSKTNLEVASKMGFKTIFFDDSSRDVGALKEQLKKLNLKL